MTLVGYEAAGGEITSRTYYIEDDWGDNALSGRTDPTSGPWFYQPVPSQPGDALLGRYRPEWDVLSGSPSASSGVLTVPSTTNDPALHTDAQMAAGTWKIDFSYAGTSGTNSSQFTPIEGETTGRWMTLNPHQGTGDYKLNVNATDIISATWSPNTNWHTAQCDRSDGGSYEIFLDGTSKGTATDSSAVPDEKRYVHIITFSSGNDCSYDDLQVQ